MAYLVCRLVQNQATSWGMGSYLLSLRERVRMRGPKGLAPVSKAPHPPALSRGERAPQAQLIIPNARGQARDIAGARNERPLCPVVCTPLILIETPSPAYHGGMLIAGNYHSRTRRRPHAILHPTAQSVLR